MKISPFSMGLQQTFQLWLNSIFCNKKTRVDPALAQSTFHATPWSPKAEVTNAVAAFEIWLASTFLSLPKVISLSSSQNKSLKQLFHLIFSNTLISRVCFLIVQTYSFKYQEWVLLKLITEKCIKHFKRDIMAKESWQYWNHRSVQSCSLISLPHPSYLFHLERHGGRSKWDWNKSWE